MTTLPWLRSRALSRALAPMLVLAAGLTMVSETNAQLTRGTSPEHEFESPLVNGMGTGSLADLQGKMVFVEFWGTF